MIYLIFGMFVLILLNIMLLGLLIAIVYYVYVNKKLTLISISEVKDTKEYFRKREFLSKKSIDKISSIENKVTGVEQFLQDNSMTVTK